MTQAGADRKEEYGWEARAQWHGRPLTSLVSIEVTLYFGDKRRRDFDNFFKLSIDALSGIVWEDDSQIEECHVRKRYDKDSPRIEIIIHEIEYGNEETTEQGQEDYGRI